MDFVLNKFLFCFELESGGIFLGWLGAIVHCLLVIIFTLFLCFGKKLLPLLFAYLVKQEQKNNREKREIGITDLRNEPEFARRTSNDQSIQELLGIGLGLLVVISAIVYGILFLRLWAYECLLNGSKSRNHKKVLIFVIIDGICVVISLLCLPFAFGIDTAAFVLISIYFSFCTYSLYRKLEKQSNQGTGYGAPSELTTINTSPNKQPQVGYP